MCNVQNLVKSFLGGAAVSAASFYLLKRNVPQEFLMIGLVAAVVYLVLDYVVLEETSVDEYEYVGVGGAENEEGDCAKNLACMEGVLQARQSNLMKRVLTDSCGEYNDCDTRLACLSGTLKARQTGRMKRLMKDSCGL